MKKPKPVAVQVGQMKVKSRGTGHPLRRWDAPGPVTVQRSSERPAPVHRQRARFSLRRPAARSGGSTGKTRPGASRPAWSWQSTALLQTAACLLILAAAWGFSQSEQPWAREASAAMQSAVTTEIDLDRSLGKLQFVRELLPDAAFVFGGDGLMPALALPCEGLVAVGYAAEHPGLLLRGADAVTAPADGEVLGVAWADGEASVRIGHTGGLESVIACLSDVIVAEGDAVVRGAALGTASAADGDARVYFETRVDGKAVDPLALIQGAPDRP